MPTKRAEDVEIGDTIITDNGAYRVEGWYFDARGRMVLEYNGRWHAHYTREQLEVRPCEK